MLAEFLMKLPAPWAGLPGNVKTITGSALTPLRESVTALLAYLPTGQARQGIPPTCP
jgi:hypothetical protein